MPTIRAPRRGLVRFKAVPLGISSVVAVFQRQKKKLLGEDLLVAGVQVYLHEDALPYEALTQVSEAASRTRKDKFMTS